jgi:hypothetical protein
MSETIHDKFQKYLELQRQLVEVRKQQRESKKILETLEKEIKSYMTNNDMDSISLKEGEIVLYAKKISQTFKKETMVERLTEKLNDPQKAQELTQSIIDNKKYILEDKIKAIIKKK